MGIKEAIEEDYRKSLAAEAANKVINGVMKELIDIRIRSIREHHPKLSDEDVYKRATDESIQWFRNALMESCKK